MPKSRPEAISDGIIAFAITLLILEIHVPELVQAPKTAPCWDRTPACVLARNIVGL